LDNLEEHKIIIASTDASAKVINCTQIIDNLPGAMEPVYEILLLERDFKIIYSVNHFAL